MRFWRRHWLITIIIVATLLTYFVPYATEQYLDDPPGRQDSCHREDGAGDPKHIARPAHLGEVVKIRLTDAGEFVDRCEISDVLYELNWDTPGDVRPDRRVPEAPHLPKFVVLYVHGWKHNASDGDDDVENFRTLIHGLAQANADRKQLLGVYIGWNATSKIWPFDRPPFDNLTFWSKQRIADRIAQSAVTTKIISAIGSVMSEGDSAANQFVTIGHSFGARLLFSATNQSLIYDTQKAHPGYRGGVYRTIHGIANAVILLNPAFEAARYTALNSVTRIQERFANDQLPLLLSVSSDGDWATKAAFPFGQLVDHYRSGAELTSLGNYPRYQTHWLVRADSPDCVPSDWDHLSERFVEKELCLARIPPDNDRITQPRNPFLIARTTSDIIKDHSDVWNDKFSEWLFAYVNELGNQRRPRLLDKEAKQTTSATIPTIAEPSKPAGFKGVHEH